MARRDTFAVQAWLASELGLDEVAAGAEAAEIDGATALEMDKEDWKELGATGIQSAKIVGALKKLAGGCLWGARACCASSPMETPTKPTTPLTH